MRLPFRRVAAALAALAVAGCGSTPPERVHSLLAATPESAAPFAAPASLPFVFVLSPVRLPPGVEGPQWLVRLPDETLVRLEQERWSASLREELRAALADGLARRGGVEARTAPGPVAGVRIDLDMRRFETAPGRGVSVAGTFTLVPPAAAGAPLAPGLRCGYERSEAEAGAAPALAAAHRRVVEDLAARIAITASRAGTGSAVCP